MDKLTLAGLEATLQAYVEGEKAAYKQIPILRFLKRQPEELREVGESAFFLRSYNFHITVFWKKLFLLWVGVLIQVSDCRPFDWCFRIQAKKAEEIEKALRFGHPSVIAMLERGKVVFDLRTIEHFEESELLRRLREVVNS